MPYENSLKLVRNGKGIPYGPRNHADGTENHGYVRLKGNVAAVDHIEEAKDITPLADILKAINADDSIYFSVGCAFGWMKTEEKKFYAHTYVEFAFNDTILMAGAQHYAPLFLTFELERGAAAQDLGVQLVWELAGATVLDGAETCDGFTCTIFVRTGLMDSESLVAQNIRQVLSLLEEHLMAVQDRFQLTGQRIYAT